MHTQSNPSQDERKVPDQKERETMISPKLFTARLEDVFRKLDWEKSGT